MKLSVLDVKEGLIGVWSVLLDFIGINRLLNAYVRMDIIMILGMLIARSVLMYV